MMPEKLKKCDTIAVIAPSNTADENDIIYLEKSKKLFKKAGIKVVYGKNIFSKTLKYGSTVEEKIEDLHWAFLSKEIKAIFCVKGGENSNSLFEYINYNLIKENPKIICGFSDNTSILNMINERTGLVTYHGPTFKSLTSWETEYAFNNVINFFMKNQKQLGELEDKYLTVKEGKAKGKLIGGNLNLITQMVTGKYNLNFENKILFIEELGYESNPTLVNNHLYFMKQNNVFDKISGLWIGNYEHASNITLEEIVLEIIKDKDYKFPIIKSNNFGHIDKKIVIPIGANAIIDTNEKQKIKLV